MKTTTSASCLIDAVLAQVGELRRASTPRRSGWRELRDGDQGTLSCASP
jgi:hypothetical protein